MTGFRDLAEASQPNTAAKFASWCSNKKKEKREKKKIVQRVALCRIPSQKERENLLQDVLLVFSYLNVSFRPTP
jgi:hypothetical protein